MTSFFAIGLSVSLQASLPFVGADCTMSDGLPLVQLCPSHAGPKSQVSINLKKGNPFRELAVFTPSGESKFLVIDDFVSIPFRDFPWKDTFILTPLTLKDSQGFIFRESGTYTFYFADNTETERESAKWASVALYYDGNREK